MPWASVSTLSRILTGEATCLLRAWTLSRTPNPPSAKLATFLASHARLTQQIAARAHGTLAAERQVWDRAGLRGRIDLVERTDRGYVLHEIKTGQRRTSHITQLLLYMALWIERGEPLESGILHYPDGDLYLSPEDATPELLMHARELASTLRAEEPPRPIEEDACSYCEIECPLRIAWRQRANGVSA